MSCQKLFALVDKANGTHGALDRPCDVVYVDGGHSYDAANCDLRLLSVLARRGATVVADDVNPDCETDFAAGHCDGPLVAWRGVVADGVVADAACDVEDFCVGTYAARDTAYVARVREHRAELAAAGFRPS